MDHFIGIDPDTKCSGIAHVIRDNGMPVLSAVWAAQNPKWHKGPVVIGQLEAVREFYNTFMIQADVGDTINVVIEDQQAYGKQDKTDPNALIRLAQVAGMWASAFSGPVQFVLPRIWKKQVPKQIHQARTASALGLRYQTKGKPADGYVVPETDCARNFTKDSCWKHVMDAVGLALWASRQT